VLGLEWKKRYEPVIAADLDGSDLFGLIRLKNDKINKKN